MLLEKQIKKIFFRQDITQNIFLLPFIMVLLQFCYLFVALVNSHYYFEHKVLFVAGGLVFLWGIYFVSVVRKEKNFTKNWKNILLVICFVCLCLLIIYNIWFTIYFRIDAIKCFFEGRMHLDTLYHSAHAESIISNGYPSLLYNSSAFHAYHCFSHYLIAGLSFILGIPCFITYNYVYPIVFFPLYFFLLQKAVIIGKSIYNNTKQFKLLDYLVIICMIYSFFPAVTQRKMGYCLLLILCSTDTILISLVLLFLYFFLADIGYRKIKNFENFNCFLLIPIFIFILTYTKISTGFIFLLGASYYFFRKYLLINIKCLCFVGYLLLFFIFNYVLFHIYSTFQNPTDSKESIIQLFYFVKKFCYKGQFKWILFHYLFLFLPVFFVIGYSKKKIFVKGFLYNRDTIFQEMCLLLMLGSCLPGILLKNDSSFCFVIPIYLFSWVLFICCNIPEKLSIFYIHFCKKNTILYKLPVLFCVLVICYSTFLVKDMHFHRTIVATLRSRISLVDFRKDVSGKVKEYFSPAAVLNDEEYTLFNQILMDLEDVKKKDYCAFLSSDSNIISKNDLSWYKPPHNVYYARPYWSIGAYLGIPVINGMYEDNNLFYRGDGKLFGSYNDFPGYGLPPALCDKKITQSNMIERAKLLHKKHLVVINQHSYEIIDIE